jgi:hypothetical protein
MISVIIDKITKYKKCIQITRSFYLPVSIFPGKVLYCIELATINISELQVKINFTEKLM